MDLTFFEICMVSAVGLILGAMGAIIGSTLLVIVPMLSLLGLPIQTAIGTGKISVIGREITPAIYFYGKKLVKPKIAIPFSITAASTSWFGSVVAVSLDALVLEKIVALFMFLICAIMLINPKIGMREKEIAATPLNTAISIILGALVGFYTGVFGGGANVFIIIVFIFIFGNTFLQATANSKAPNLLITAASIPIFVLNDYVNWEIAIPLTVSTAAGSYFGARLAIKKGNKFIRNLFIGFVIVLALKYLIK